MEMKCPNCGNMFNDILSVCPACGTEVERTADMPAAEAPVDFATPAAEPVYEAAPETASADAAQQTVQDAPSYQYASYSYGAGEPQPQPTYQQANYQQANYQQPNYQQQGYQQQGYQQANYQQQGYPQQGYYPQQNMYGTDPNAKSKLVAGLLGIFLGGLGVHNFYLGYTGKAIAQLLISLLSCGALAAVSAVWGLVEGILILTGSTITTDASGRPLGE